MLSAIFGAIAAIPIFDKWAERGISAYRNWKLNRDIAESNQAINNADHGETGDLNSDIGSKT